ncbi:hypothetical protein R1flu_017054 [Riccia fluitans]|uniref:Uncharacterized protein n=1 Tax=Riccia fluitans TaxID=41844 RepID=A0ABD1YNW0_9MARC
MPDQSIWVRICTCAVGIDGFEACTREERLMASQNKYRRSAIYRTSSVGIAAINVGGCNLASVPSSKVVISSWHLSPENASHISYILHDTKVLTTKTAYSCGKLDQGAGQASYRAAWLILIG